MASASIRCSSVLRCSTCSPLPGLPLLYNVIISFQQVDVFSLGTLLHPGAGWDNYLSIFRDPLAQMVLWNTIIFTVGSVAFQFTIGFAFALFFHQKFPGATWFRGLFLAAWVMPGLVVGVLWNWLLSGDFGVINHVLLSMGSSPNRSSGAPTSTCRSTR